MTYTLPLCFVLYYELFTYILPHFKDYSGDEDEERHLVGSTTRHSIWSYLDDKQIMGDPRCWRSLLFLNSFWKDIHTDKLSFFGAFVVGIPTFWKIGMMITPPNEKCGSFVLFLMFAIDLYCVYVICLPCILARIYREYRTASSPMAEKRLLTALISLYGYSLMYVLLAQSMYPVFDAMYHPTIKARGWSVVIPFVISGVFVYRNLPTTASTKVPLRRIMIMWHFGFLLMLLVCFNGDFDAPPFDFYVLPVAPELKGNRASLGLQPMKYDGTVLKNCNSSVPTLTSTIPSVEYLEHDNLALADVPTDSEFGRFWETEWSTYGSCTGWSYIDYLFVSSIHKMILPYDVLSSNGKASKRRLVDALGGSKQVATICDHESRLLEFRICIERHGKKNTPLRRIHCPRFILNQDNCTDILFVDK